MINNGGCCSEIWRCTQGVCVSTTQREVTVSRARWDTIMLLGCLDPQQLQINVKVQFCTWSIFIKLTCWFLAQNAHAMVMQMTVNTVQLDQQLFVSTAWIILLETAVINVCQDSTKTKLYFWMTLPFAAVSLPSERWWHATISDMFPSKQLAAAVH